MAQRLLSRKSATLPSAETLSTMKSLIRKLYLVLTCLSFSMVGCISTRSISSHNDRKFFKESPQIIHAENHYFLRFVYSDSEDASGFAMFTASRIQNDSLIFYLPVTTSSFNMRGKTQYEEITSPNKLSIIAEGKVFWEEPDKSLVHISVEQSSKSYGQLVNDRQNKH